MKKTASRAKDLSFFPSSTNVGSVTNRNRNHYVSIVSKSDLSQAGMNPFGALTNRDRRSARRLTNPATQRSLPYPVKRKDHQLTKNILLKHEAGEKFSFDDREQPNGHDELENVLSADAASNLHDRSKAAKGRQ